LRLGFPREVKRTRGGSVPSATSRGGESLHVASLLANPMATGSQDRSLSQRPSVCKDGRAVPAASSASEIAASRHGLTVLEHQATRHPRDVGGNQRHRGTQAVASRQETGGRRTVCSRVCGYASGQGRSVSVDATVTEPLRWKGFWVGLGDVVISSYFTWRT